MFKNHRQFSLVCIQETDEFLVLVTFNTSSVDQLCSNAPCVFTCQPSVPPSPHQRRVCCRMNDMLTACDNLQFQASLKCLNPQAENEEAETAAQYVWHHFLCCCQILLKYCVISLVTKNS